MTLIATSIEPPRVTRILPSCRDAPLDPAEFVRTAHAIEGAAVLAVSAQGWAGEAEMTARPTASWTVLGEVTHSHDWGYCRLPDERQSATGGGSNA
jgi:hypothetical protein